MKRILLVLALVLGGLFGSPSPADASHFPQGWHWPRTHAATGSYSTQYTVVYFQNDAPAHQGWLIQGIADSLDAHRELLVRVVDTCPAGKNCVRWNAGDINGGVTSIAVGSNAHIVGAVVTLDEDLGLPGSYTASRDIGWHEGACHAFGGGFTDAYHYLCNYPYRKHHMESISKYYHDDPETTATRAAETKVFTAP